MRTLILSLLAALTLAMALGASSASANPFCGEQRVNQYNKCWGSARLMSGGKAWGSTTGVCVGAGLINGTCAPVSQLAFVTVPHGLHAPWVIGTATAFTWATADTWQ